VLVQPVLEFRVKIDMGRLQLNHARFQKA